jgi:hypothetical protein
MVEDIKFASMRRLDELCIIAAQTEVGGRAKLFFGNSVGG